MVEEDELFKLALSAMHTIYTFCCFRVIVLPNVLTFEDDGFFSRNFFSYFTRGWCFVECTWAWVFGRIAKGAAESQTP